MKHDWIARDIMPFVESMVTQYPVVAIEGPRQSGKTTIAKMKFPDKPYYNLEDPQVYNVIHADPKGFFDRHPDGMILDEVQRSPDLLSYIQVCVDAREQASGQYIITGSQQFNLNEKITQSLAGRVAMITLLPCTLQELGATPVNSMPDKWMFNGFYPKIYRDDLSPSHYYANYLRTYVERDVRQMMNIGNLRQFEQFLRLLAGRIGSTLNLQSISQEMGTSSPTLKSWLSILEASYIIYLLPPYFENLGKRALKSPKLYFHDVGLAAYLVGINNESTLVYDRMRGPLFENMVVMEFVKQLANRGLKPNIYFYRDSQQFEVDLVMTHGSKLVPIEIKSSSTYHSSFEKGVQRFKRFVPDRVDKGYVIYSGDMTFSRDDVELVNYTDVAAIITGEFTH